MQKEMESLKEKFKGHRDRYISSNIHIMEIPKGERRKSVCVGGRWGEAIIKERRAFHAAEDNEGFHP